MKLLILGCGNIGSVAAEDIAKSTDSIEVVIADKNEVKAREVAERISRGNVSWIQLDAANYNELVNALKDFDLAMGFLPGKFGYRLAEACIDAGKGLVDISYMPENPLTLNEKAIKAGATVIPDCGLAPGISNILVGRAMGKLDKVLAVHIMVGGLPEECCGAAGRIFDRICLLILEPTTDWLTASRSTVLSYGGSCLTL